MVGIRQVRAGDGVFGGVEDEHALRILASGVLKFLHQSAVLCLVGVVQSDVGPQGPAKWVVWISGHVGKIDGPTWCYVAEMLMSGGFVLSKQQHTTAQSQVTDASVEHRVQD